VEKDGGLSVYDFTEEPDFNETRSTMSGQPRSSRSRRRNKNNLWLRPLGNWGSLT